MTTVPLCTIAITSCNVSIVKVIIYRAKHSNSWDKCALKVS